MTIKNLENMKTEEINQIVYESAIRLRSLASRMEVNDRIRESEAMSDNMLELNPCEFSVINSCGAMCVLSGCMCIAPFKHGKYNVVCPLKDAYDKGIKKWNEENEPDINIFYPYDHDKTIAMRKAFVNGTHEERQKIIEGINNNQL
jgi:hypothetical protein